MGCRRQRSLTADRTGRAGEDAALGRAGEARQQGDSRARPPGRGGGSQNAGPSGNDGGAPAGKKDVPKQDHVRGEGGPTGREGRRRDRGPPEH